MPDNYVVSSHRNFMCNQEEELKNSQKGFVGSGPDEGSMKKLDSGGKVVAKGSSRDASVPEDERQYPLKPRSKHRRY